MRQNGNMSGRNPLKSVLKVKQQALDKAQEALARIIASRQQAEQTAQMAHARALMTTPVSSNPGEWILADVAKKRLLEQAAEAERRAESLKQSEVEATEDVNRAMAEARAVERLLEQRQLEAKRAEEARERKALDETASLRYFRSRQ